MPGCRAGEEGRGRPGPASGSRSPDAWPSAHVEPGPRGGSAAGDWGGRAGAPGPQRPAGVRTRRRSGSGLGQRHPRRALGGRLRPCSLRRPRPPRFGWLTSVPPGVRHRLPGAASALEGRWPPAPTVVLSVISLSKAPRAPHSAVCDPAQLKLEVLSSGFLMMVARWEPATALLDLRDTELYEF